MKEQLEILSRGRYCKAIYINQLEVEIFFKTRILTFTGFLEVTGRES